MNEEQAKTAWDNASDEHKQFIEQITADLQCNYQFLNTDSDSNRSQNLSKAVFAVTTEYLWKFKERIDEISKSFLPVLEPMRLLIHGYENKLSQLEQRIAELEKPKFACPVCHRIVDELINKEMHPEAVKIFGDTAKYFTEQRCKHCEK